jgi:hypothetical protein
MRFPKLPDDLTKLSKKKLASVRGKLDELQEEIDNAQRHLNSVADRLTSEAARRTFALDDFVHNPCDEEEGTVGQASFTARTRHGLLSYSVLAGKPEYVEVERFTLDGAPVRGSGVYGELSFDDMIELVADGPTPVLLEKLADAVKAWEDNFR